jgi:leucyl/phenylalanyl-tRNA--protein transferase
VHISRSLGKVLRQDRFQITKDRAFRAVMEGCAEEQPGRGETWITREFLDAYTRLHEQGHAHSLECWEGERLSGGIYGVAVGGLFAGESMFHRASNASKVAVCRSSPPSRLHAIRYSNANAHYDATGRSDHST